MWLSLLCLCMGSHSVSHVGARRCDRERRAAADVRAFKWASSGHGPLVTSSRSWQSTTIILLCSDHMWHIGTLLPGEPARSVGALNHQRDATALQDLYVRSSDSWVLAGRRIWDWSVWVLWAENVTWQAWRWWWQVISHYGTRFCFPRSFNMKLQTMMFKKGCQSRMLAWSLCWHVFVHWIAVSRFHLVAVLFWSRMVWIVQWIMSKSFLPKLNKSSCFMEHSQ